MGLLPCFSAIFTREDQFCDLLCVSLEYKTLFSLPGRSSGRAIVLLLASALAKCLSFEVKVFYVMGKALSGELPCPCDRSCFSGSTLRGKNFLLWEQILSFKS